jgi:uncharacterized membrane protein (DUF2068 family)
VVGVLLLLSGPAAITGAIELLFAYGAWTLKPWGWWLGIVGTSLALLQAVIAIIQGYSVALQIVDVAIALVILFYLSTPNVRRAFGRESPGSGSQDQ